MTNPTNEPAHHNGASEADDSSGDRRDPYSTYSMHLSRASIDNVFHYTHYIPRGKGFTAKFFADHYPDWTIDTMLAVFRAADIISREDPCGMMGKCHWKVKVLHFNSADDLHVEWNDEIQEDDGRYFWRGENQPDDERRPSSPQLDTGGFLLALDGLDLRKRRVRKRLLKSINEKIGTDRPKRSD